MKIRPVLFTTLFISLIAMGLIFRPRTSRGRASNLRNNGTAPALKAENINESSKQLPVDVKEAYLKNKSVDRDYDWKRPIAFYGKTLDQSGDPVQEANVKMSWTDLSERGTGHTNIVTAADGSFSIQGVFGKTLVVQISKNGYSKYPSNQEGFEYADPFIKYFHQPDPAKPVLFRLFKHNEQKLLNGKKKAALTHDNQDCRIELDTKSNGPKPVIVVRSWTEARTSIKPQPDWRVEITIENAEIQEINNALKFEAPELGFVNTLKWESKGGSGAWTSDFEKQVMFKTTDGLYGRLAFEFLTWGEAVGVEYWINPTGSRNLDPGPGN